MYKGLCTVSTCEHWDGVLTYREANRTIKHEAWGKSQRQRKEKQKAEPRAS